MIVSPSLNLIFVHIPKNAGTTIEVLLDPWLDPETDLHLSKASTLPPNFASAGVDSKADLSKHSSADQIRAAMDAKVFDRRFSFAFTRNPFARCFSAYHFCLAQAKRDAAGTKNAGEGQSAAFLTLSFDEVCENLGFVSLMHSLFFPQVVWLPTKGRLNFLGRVENLADDLTQVFETAGVPASALQHIPVRNAKTKPDAWRGMSGQAVDAIRSYYADDFDRFEYSTDPAAREDAVKQQPARSKAAPMQAGHP